jgi:hypothetical protein
MKTTVITFSCHGWPCSPADVMGERAAVPETAAKVVAAQLA